MTQEKPIIFVSDKNLQRERDIETAYKRLQSVVFPYFFASHEQHEIIEEAFYRIERDFRDCRRYCPQCFKNDD